MRLLKYSSNRFKSRIDYTYPEVRGERNRSVRRISLVPVDEKLEGGLPRSGKRDERR